MLGNCGSRVLFFRTRRPFFANTLPQRVRIRFVCQLLNRKGDDRPFSRMDRDHIRDLSDRRIFYTRRDQPDVIQVSDVNPSQPSRQT
jgi:hypothetical protein